MKYQQNFTSFSFKTFQGQYLKKKKLIYLRGLRSRVRENTHDCQSAAGDRHSYESSNFHDRSHILAARHSKARLPTYQAFLVRTWRFFVSCKL